MASTLICKITKRNYEGSDAWEGTVSLVGIKPTKLVKSNSQDSLFGSHAAVANAAKNFAKRLSISDVSFDEGNTKTTSKKTSSTKRAKAAAK